MMGIAVLLNFLVSVQQIDLSSTVIHGFAGQGKVKIGRPEDDPKRRDPTESS
jgi:hypothetical protein